MFMILLSCRSSHATKSQSTCEDQLKIYCVPARANVHVSCPQIPGEDVTFNLLKEEEVIYNYTCIGAIKASNCTSRYTRVGVDVHEITENKSVSFMLTGVKASSYGIYRCEGMNTFPPPYYKVASTSWVLVRIEGHQCKSKQNNSKLETGGEQTERFLWICIVGLVVLCIYSLIVSIVACVIWVKWRRSDSQSDYMNTKPKAARDRKKKRGVQIPIPRHF